MPKGLSGDKRDLMAGMCCCSWAKWSGQDSPGWMFVQYDRRPEFVCMMVVFNKSEWQLTGANGSFAALSFPAPHPLGGGLRPA